MLTIFEILKEKYPNKPWSEGIASYYVVSPVSLDDLAIITVKVWFETIEEPSLFEIPVK